MEMTNEWPANQILQVESDPFLADILMVRESYALSAGEKIKFEARYSKELRDSENRKFYLSFDETELPVAYVQLILKNADKDLDLADGKITAHIHDLRVRKDVQSRGFGQSLMRHLEDEARRLQFRRLTLGVESTNSRALGFYENLGYRKFKQQPGRFDSEAVFYMNKSLD